MGAEVPVPSFMLTKKVSLLTHFEEEDHYEESIKFYPEPFNK
jgi:hypothetical protein